MQQRPAMPGVVVLTLKTKENMLGYVLATIRTGCAAEM
jgi:hypothetical protein